MDYDKDIAIDPLKLDEEWLNQPVLYMQYSDMLRKAKDKENLLKEKLDYAEKNKRLDIFQNPENYNVTKPTASVIEALISKDEYIKQFKEMLTSATRETNAFTVAVKSFEMKKKALENLVILYTSEYFSTPKQSTHIKGGKRDLGKAQKSASITQKTSLNKKKRKKIDK